MTLQQAVEVAQLAGYWGIVWSITFSALFMLLIMFSIFELYRTKTDEWCFGIFIGIVFLFMSLMFLDRNIAKYNNPKARVTDIRYAKYYKFIDYHWELVPNKKERDNEQSSQ